MPLTWADLAARTLARQFPASVASAGSETAVSASSETAVSGSGAAGQQRPGPDAADVVRVVGAVGPIQAQTARSPFLGLAARLPGSPTSR